MQIHKLALVESDAIGNDSHIAAFAVIRPGAIIGRGVRIHPHVVVEPGVVVGDGTEVFPGAVLGRRPAGAGATSRPVEYHQQVEVGCDCSIGPHAVIYYDVTIGPNTLIGDGASIREGARIGSRCIISRYVTLNYNVSVGDGSKIMDLSHITGNSVIGAGAFISTGVLSTNDNALGAGGYDDERIAGPNIADGSMVGAGAIFLPRTTVGSGAIVGAGAVVTKDVQENTRVMGVPARQTL